jgi:hypothetical protein
MPTEMDWASPAPRNHYHMVNQPVLLEQPSSVFSKEWLALERAGGIYGWMTLDKVR